MSEKIIRFGVRAPTRHQAMSWKVWAPSGAKNDIYLACRALKGELKASLHQSGNWHVAFTRKLYEEGFADESSRPESRFTDRWPRPLEIGPGVILAFRIVVPWFSATVPIVEEESDVTWITSAPDGQAIEFDIFITAPTCIVSGWPAKRAMNSLLVGSFILSSDETVWVVYRTVSSRIPLPKQGSPRFFKGEGLTSLKSSGLRAISFGKEADGSRVIYDVPIIVE